MKICFIYQSNYPWDVRVQKIASSLKTAGHEVFIVASNEQGKERKEVTQEAEVIRLPRILKGEGRVNEILNFPLFFNPLWTSTINTVTKENKIDLIIVRDLPLALAAINAGKKYHIPVIMDMAECYPELLRSIWEFGAGSLVKRITHNPALGDYVEKKVLSKVNHVFAMIEESRDRLIRLGYPPENISIVSNTPPINKFDFSGLEKRHIDDSCIKLIYAGWINKGRGVDKAIEGIAEYCRIFDYPVRLDVFGDGDAMDICKALVEKHNLHDVVILHGWTSHESIVNFTTTCHIGLVSHRNCSHWNNTIPNKLFDYMASGMSILTSDAVPVARIVTDEKSGLVYKDDDPGDFAYTLNSMVPREMRIEMARNGVAAVKLRYNWSYDEETMLSTIERMVN